MGHSSIDLGIVQLLGKINLSDCDNGITSSMYI